MGHVLTFAPERCGHIEEQGPIPVPRHRPLHGATHAEALAVQPDLRIHANAPGLDRPGLVRDRPLDANAVPALIVAFEPSRIAPPIGQFDRSPGRVRRGRRKAASRQEFRGPELEGPVAAAHRPPARSRHARTRLYRTGTGRGCGQQRAQGRGHGRRPAGRNRDASRDETPLGAGLRARRRLTYTRVPSPALERSP